MSNEAFDGQILSEKLSKLNNSQQSIEFIEVISRDLKWPISNGTNGCDHGHFLDGFEIISALSRWCVSHRKKARQIVETWDKLFNGSQKEQRVSFLYLANDILQTSRRKGSEFVNEFWKVLPAALKHVFDSDEYGKKAVTRLVDIWEERKVFGSRGQGLKDELLGKNTPAQPASTVKNSNLIKIAKRDAHSVRIKLAVGSLPEKILTAFQSVLDKSPNEESALSKCSAAVSHAAKIRKDVEDTPMAGNQHTSASVELQELETVIQQCIDQLESAEATRLMLVSQLKEALHEQESKLELIHGQLQDARGRIDQASNLSKRETSATVSGPSAVASGADMEATRVAENMPQVQQSSNLSPQPPVQPVVSFAPVITTDEESKKAAAAAVAAKLAASTSSAQMLTSVLSSLVAEEAASLNASIRSTGFGTGLNMFSPEKRQKIEKQLPKSDISGSDMENTTYFAPLQQQPGTSMPVVSPSTSMQPMSQSNQVQASFSALPPLPPPLSASSVNPSGNQYVPSPGMMVGVMPFGYGTNALPPPPPLPPHIAMGLTRPPQSQPQQPQQQQQQQQIPATGGYYRPPGIGFYGQGHQPAAPTVPRQ